MTETESMHTRTYRTNIVLSFAMHYAIFNIKMINDFGSFLPSYTNHHHKGIYYDGIGRNNNNKNKKKTCSHFFFLCVIFIHHKI